MLKLLFDSFSSLICWAFVLTLFFYNGYRFCIIVAYLFHKRRKVFPNQKFEKLPTVTIQLPTYNESKVLQRLIKSVCELNYPKELLDIQVLDDSTDETAQLAAQCVKEYQKEGFKINLLHRETRLGFKAGALQEGLHQAQGELIAIFDADFVPSSDFLLKTIHYFTDPKIGMVQARWGFINRHYSYVTRFQSVLINGWLIEQCAHFFLKKFFNFHGTAGVWRKTAILDSGGWSSDTLCEDLDLSYRAVIRDWKFIYLKDVVVPSELPIEVQAFKNQQYRWYKGTTQARLKMIPLIWRSKLSFWKKSDLYLSVFEKMSGLMTSLLGFFAIHFCFVSLFIFAEDNYVRPICLSLAFSIFVFVVYYSIAEIENNSFSLKRFLEIIFSCIPIAGGISVTASSAFLDGIFGRKTPFVRTPKYGANNQKMKKFRSLTPVSFNFVNITEIVMAYLYLSVFFFTLFQILHTKKYEMLLLLVYGTGFVFMATHTLFTVFILEFFKKNQHIVENEN